MNIVIVVVLAATTADNSRVEPKLLAKIGDQAIHAAEVEAELRRAYGVREIAAGMGILGSRNGDRAPWVWSRVAGDALDLASLSGGLSDRNPTKANVKMALASVINGGRTAK